MTSLNDDLDNSNQQSESQPLLQSNSKLTSLDDVIRQCGGLGRFQWLQYFFLSLVHISAGLAAYYYVYGAGEADHRCKLPSSIWPNDDQYNPINNNTYQSLVNSFIPKTDDKWDQCHLYDSMNMTKSLISCSNGWIFDRKIFGFTFIEEMNLVCHDKSKKSLLSTLVQIGGFLVLAAGIFADKFGRKRTLLITSILIFTICFLTQIALQWIQMSIDLKFAILLISQFMAGLTLLTSNIAFVMMLELTIPAHRSIAGNMTFIFYASGELLITLFSYLTRNWLNLLWANTIFFGVSLIFVFFTIESPLYLYSKKEYTKLENCLRRMAKINSRNESDWRPAFEELISKHLSTTINKKELSLSETFQQLVLQRRTMQRIIITSLLAFKDTLLYYKISYGLATMKVSPYLSMLIGGILEAIGYISATIVMSTRLGRKYSLIISTGLTGICVLAVPLLINRSTVATVIVSQIGKYATSVANSITWIYIAELFPTSIRSSTNGFALAVSRLGAITAPVIDASIDEQYLPITFYAYAGLAFISILVTLPLPETKDESLAEAVHVSQHLNS